MSFLRNLLYPLGVCAEATYKLAEKRNEMRPLFPTDYGAAYMDPVARAMLRDAGLDKAEEFIEMIKTCPLYQKRVCENTKKKLEAKRAEVLALEKTLTGDCM